MGKHGLTIDNLISAEVVTADGQVRKASATKPPRAQFHGDRTDLLQGPYPGGLASRDLQPSWAMIARTSY